MSTEKEEYSYKTKYALLEYLIANIICKIKNRDIIRLVDLPFDSHLSWLVEEVNKMIEKEKGIVRED